jgi:hypothetical protein
MEQKSRRSTALCDFGFCTVFRTRQSNARSALLNTLHTGSSLYSGLASNLELATAFASDAKAAGSFVSVANLRRLLALGDLVSCRSSGDLVDHVVDVGIVIVLVGNAMSRQWRSGVDCEDMNLLEILHGASEDLQGRR